MWVDRSVTGPEPHRSGPDLVVIGRLHVLPFGISGEAVGKVFQGFKGQTAPCGKQSTRMFRRPFHLSTSHFERVVCSP